VKLTVRQKHAHTEAIGSNRRQPHTEGARQVWTW
jgi:hypothetical protein